MALCTKKQVKAFMGQMGKDDVADAQIDALIPAVSKAIESYCGRTFEVTEHTEYHDGQGDDALFTNNYPITTVSGIWEDVFREWGDGTLVASTDYVVLEDRILMKGYYFEKGKKNIKVIYSAGYETIPSDLQQVAVQEVTRTYKNIINLGKSSITVGVENATTTNFITDAFLPDSKLVLDRYRNYYIV